MKIKTLVGAIALMHLSTAFAANPIELGDVTVTINRFEAKESETTYASEIHTAHQIEASGATTLYDYLSQQSTLNISPSYGNKATPSINLRGFGGENGYQNVVISVDGQRLNNIDMSPQLLSAIPLSSIERIEISKGSGSVIYGDGATAGAIQITTKAKQGISLSSSLGNAGQQNHALSAGFSEQYFDLTVNLADDRLDGYSKKDSTGFRDELTGTTQNIKLKLRPTDSLRLIAEGSSSRNDIRYVSPMTRAQFRDNPRTAPARYTHQSFDTDQWRVGGEFDITPHLQLRAVHYNEDKFSEFVSATPSTADYIYKTDEITLSYQNDAVSIIGGYQNFDGERKAMSNFGIVTTNKTNKDNQATFISGEYRFGNVTVTAGTRNERVKYRFRPVINPFSTSAAQYDDDIDAWDAGINYRFNEQVSIFANYNQAYQAPDIDRLFNFGGGFNGFIKPTRVKTINTGLTQISSNNRLKVSAFYADLDNEIYLDQASFVNTNIDASHKYGLEVQDHWKVNDNLGANLSYTYVRAKIDRENENAGAYNGKNLPGVPKHSVVANFNWMFYPNASLNLNHTWRSQAYAYNDLKNDFRQRQSHYESTNLALNYQFELPHVQKLNVFASVNNLFEHENSTQVADDSIYPVDFVRTWRIGVRADF